MGTKAIGLDDPCEFYDHFWSRVDIRGENDCWEWTGSRCSKGYGTACWPATWHRAGLTSGYVVGTHRIAAILSGRLRPTSKLHALHGCDNPPCCNPAHLRGGTNRENIIESVQRGRHRPHLGTAHHSAKLTDDQVREIRRRSLDGERNVPLAREFGVNRGTIVRIVNGTGWSHLS